MYLNIETYKKNNLQPQDLYFLIGIKQVDKEVLETLNEGDFSRFNELGLLMSIKGKKGDNPVLNIRLSKRGKELLKSICTEPIAGEDEEVLYDWLSKYYIDKGKEVGNPNRVKKLLAWFSQETDIYKNNLIKLFVDFLKDDYVDEASKVLEFTLFYPKKFTTDKGKTIAYEAKPDIYDSWLFKHFEKNKQRLLETFE